MTAWERPCHDDERSAQVIPDFAENAEHNFLHDLHAPRGVLLTPDS